jgi:hypothetical protein
MTETPHINEMRRALLDTLADLRNREKPMEPDRARAVAQVASVLIDSARVEVEFLRVTDGVSSPFIAPAAGDALPPGITAITQHRIKG